MALFRAQLFSSLVILPTANALGHLAPAIGASWAAVQTRIWDNHVLALLFSVHALLDSPYTFICKHDKELMCPGYDKYRDVPRMSRPSGPAWLLWIGSLASVIAFSAYKTGYASAIQIVWYLGLEVLWAGKLIPIYTFKQGLRFVKLRQLVFQHSQLRSLSRLLTYACKFGPGKSIFCGVMAGLMDAGPAAHHACLLHPQRCAPPGQQSRALAYSMLYNFLRETIYDARDIAEDRTEGVTTLATTLGMAGTVLVLTAATSIGEFWIGGAEFSLYHAVVRGFVTVALSTLVARQPRESRVVWAMFSLASLLPAWHAQAQLLA